MRLVDALRVGDDEVIALVGGGGKTTTMFRLAREVVERGGCAVTTTTTRIFGAQIALSPVHIAAGDATRARVRVALAAHGQVLVIGDVSASTGKADGVSLELFRDLRAWCPDACLVNEADGSRMRPFKAPAAHEPVIPPETTLVVLVVGADVLGQPLDGEHVHRPELVRALAGAPLEERVTPEVVARVLAHAEGGCKGVPPGARVVALINKVDLLAHRGPVAETAARLLREPRIEAVVLAAVKSDPPVLDVVTR